MVGLVLEFPWTISSRTVPGLDRRASRDDATLRGDLVSPHPTYPELSKTLCRRRSQKAGEANCGRSRLFFGSIQS